jgi:phosphogluconate dehydratase
MPELHALTPILSNLQDMGFKVALITDGRMSGASGKIPSAIHVTPEAIDGGTISKIQDGDKIEIDANIGTLNLNENYSNRKNSKLQKDLNVGFGRNLFSLLRKNAISAESGAGLNLIND